MYAGLETFKLLLKANSQSVTRARMAIFEALQGQEPLSIHQLVERLGRRVDRASIYRAVDLFERLGIVQRLNTGWKYRLELSDMFAAHHHHLTCSQCGATTAMKEEELEVVIDNLARAHGFKPSGHQIEIQGVCTRCQEPATT